VEKLGRESFSGCRSLSAVTFEPNARLSVIESEVFVHCSSLSPVSIPASAATVR
jgi:hypothetical protein